MKNGRAYLGEEVYFKCNDRTIFGIIVATPSDKNGSYVRLGQYAVSTPALSRYGAGGLTTPRGYIPNVMHVYGDEIEPTMRNIDRISSVYGKVDEYSNFIRAIWNGPTFLEFLTSPRSTLIREYTNPLYDDEYPWLNVANSL